MTKKQLKKELIKIRDGGHITPLLEKITQESCNNYAKVKPSEIRDDLALIREKMDEFISKFPVENQSEFQLTLEVFHDYLVTGLMPSELDKKLIKEAKEDYKAGRVYTQEEVFDKLSNKLSNKTKKEIDTAINKLLKEYSPALKKLGKFKEEK